MTDDKTTQKVGFFDYLKLLAETSVVLSAGLFLIGWSYLYGYYRAFGLSAGSIDFPVNSFLVYSIPVVDSVRFWTNSFCVWFIVGMAALAVIVAFALRNNMRMKSLSPWAYPAVVVVLLVVAGVQSSKYAIGIGQRNALRDARLSTTTLPYIQLEGVDEKDAAGCNMTESSYRLLIQAGGRVYVVLPIDTEDSPVGNVRVCGFSDNRIHVMRIQAGFSESQ